jgi:hypothetical protein
MFLTRKTIWVALIGVILIISACVSAPNSSTPTAQMEKPTQAPTTAVSEPIPTLEDTQIVQEPANPTAEPQSVSDPKPTQRVGLQSSNPENVVLASGELQFLEFFAYW